MDRKPYWPKLLYKPRIRKNGDTRHLLPDRPLDKKPWRFDPKYMVRTLEIGFSIPLPRKRIEKYFLEFLATFKGIARRRLLMVIRFTPFHLPKSKLFPSRTTLFNIEWQEKFDPIRGRWCDDELDDHVKFGRRVQEYATSSSK